MTVDLGRALIVRHSLTFDLCCFIGSLILVFHVVACWLLAPSILQTSPHIFLQTPVAPPSSLPPLHISSAVTPAALTSKPFVESNLTSVSTGGVTERHLANQEPTTDEILSTQVQGKLVYGDENSTPVGAAEIDESSSNWTTQGSFVTAPHEGGNTPLPRKQSITHESSNTPLPGIQSTTHESSNTPLPGQHSSSTGSGVSNAMNLTEKERDRTCGSGFDPSMRRYVTKVYFSFCVASTVLTSFELVRCAVMCRRHRNMLKNDVDGLPYKGVALFDVFLPEFLLFFLLLADDLPISGLILASQTSIGCDLTVSTSGTTLFVAVVSTAVASSWKLFVILCRLWRRRYYGNESRLSQVLLMIVRILSLLLVTLSFILVTFNFLLMSGSKDLLANNPLLHRLFRGAGSKFWYVDDGWISLIVRRSSESPSNRSSSDDFRHPKTLVYVTSTPVIRWRDLLVLPPDTGGTVISVPCSHLEDWFFVVVPDISGLHHISKDKCNIYFRFIFLGQGEIGYNARYCIVPRFASNSSAYQSGSFLTESFVEWNCTDDGETPFTTDSSSSESTRSVERFWNDLPAESYPKRKHETCWIQISLGFWPMTPSSPLWTDCHYHFTNYDFIVPETPCGKRR